MDCKDILIFMSDQHTPVISSYMGGIARTPELEKMAENGTSYDAAYTPSPLCVPARMSFLTGRLPTKTGILNNFTVLSNTIPTIAHAFDAAGYETVLIGRMHFVGEDQRHGFQHRLVGDITSPEWKPNKDLLKKARGPFMRCFAEPGCTDVIGGGGSPVQEYDQRVVDAALEWLSKPHDKPQFIVVGTYAPHFPYITSPDKYLYYKTRVSVPMGFDKMPDYLDPALRIRVERSTKDPEVVLRAQAAYCGMIETTDEHLGAVRSAFHKYCDFHQHKGVLIYTSDHGDQCGERGLFGKMTFFEKSARIPLLMEGEGIQRGLRRKEPVSLMDLAPTLCTIADIPPLPCQDGCNILTKKDEEEYPAVISEEYGIFGAPGKFPEVKHLNSLSRMVRKGDYKFITRAGFEEWDILFDLKEDPKETKNIIREHPEIAEKLKMELKDLPDPEKVKEEQLIAEKTYDLMQRAQKPDDLLLREFWTDTSEENLKRPMVF